MKNARVPAPPPPWFTAPTPTPTFSPASSGDKHTRLGKPDGGVYIVNDGSKKIMWRKAKKETIGRKDRQHTVRVCPTPPPPPPPCVRASHGTIFRIAATETATTTADVMR